MRLIGNLKEQVKAASSKEAARNVIAKAGMMLTDEELVTVSGGIGDNSPHTDYPLCPHCGQPIPEFQTENCIHCGKPICWSVIESNSTVDTSRGSQIEP